MSNAPSFGVKRFRRHRTVPCLLSGVATGISCYDQGATIGASIVCGAASTVLTACFAGSLGKIVNGGKALSDGVSAGITATFGTGAAFIGAGANKIAVDNYQRSNNNAQGQRSSNISRNRRYGGYSRYGEYSRYGGYSGYRRTNTRNSYLRR